MLLGADDGAERPVAPGVSAPFVLSTLGVWRPCDGIRVLSRCVDDAEDSFAESGLVGCLTAPKRLVSVHQVRGRLQDTGRAQV